MKKQITFNFWRDDQKPVQEEHEPFLMEAAIVRISELLREGYTSGQLIEQVVSCDEDPEDGVEYSGWWEYSNVPDTKEQAEVSEDPDHSSPAKTFEEVVVNFSNGYSWRSGSFNPELSAGSYVRAIAPDGEVIVGWTDLGWECDPVEVMADMMRSVMDDPDDYSVELADGRRIISGSDTIGNNGETYPLGDFIQILTPDGEEVAYWDHSEWVENPESTMDAIINTASGMKINREPEDQDNGPRS